MLREERIAMGDGCELATDVYVPGDGRFPVLLMMTPYGRRGLKVLAHPVCSAGYVLVTQDVRGRYDSDGEFQPIEQERSDGPDTVRWIKQQPWYDHQAGIGVIGLSYLSEVGLALAARCPEVRAMVNIGGMAEFYDVGHRGGALTIHHALPWTIITSRSPQPSLLGIDWADVYATWPTAEAAAAAGHPNRLWTEWSEHPTRDGYWDAWSVSDDLAQVDIPILHFSGWYDVCLGATLHLFEYFFRHAGSEQQLFLGPWSHNGVLLGKQQLAGVDFGPDSASQALPRTLAWFDRFLKGKSSQHFTDQPINLRLTGGNCWLTGAEWPPAESAATDFYLGANNSLQRVPGPAGSVAFTHDPENPSPTLGGSVWEFPVAGLEPGPIDQSPLLERMDQLCFRTSLLAEPLTVAGPVECTLYAAIDGETADFVARLVDIYPSGEHRFVADGIVRAHYRLGDDQAKAAQYTIDLWAVGHTWLTGHRLGLIISGSSFPKWDINRGTLSGALRPSVQTVYCGGQHRSALRVHKTDTRGLSETTEELGGVLGCCGHLGRKS